jgi:hypothetical protein
MSTLPLSGHGAKIARAPAATPTTFTDIAELKDVTMAGLDHNEFDATSHNRNIDAYVLGVLRRELCTIDINFLPGNATHDHLTGLIKSCVTNPVPVDGFRTTFPDAVNVWLASGMVKGVKNITLPVDGLSTARLEVRYTGHMMINGVIIGN